VAASGEGYTLSGKPLDPNSATVKLFRRGELNGKAKSRKTRREDEN